MRKPALITGLVATSMFVLCVVAKADNPSFCPPGPRPGPTLTVIATIRPQLQIEINPTSVEIGTTGEPGEFHAETPIAVRVASNCGDWTVKCEATPLVSDVGAIPPERILVKHDGTSGAWVSMGGEQIIAQGHAQPPALVNTLFVGVQTQWADRPGRYIGQLNFSYLVTP